MGRPSLWVLAALGVVLASGAIPAGPAGAAAKENPPAAILTVVSGDVSVQRGPKAVPGEFGAALLAGDVVKTGKGAEAAVFLESGQIIELGPGSSITIGAIPSAKGTEPLLAEVSAGDLTRFAQTSVGGEGLSALPTLRGSTDEGRLTALSPRQTLILPGKVTFRWTPVEDVLEYRVVLMGDGAAKGSHRAQAQEWTLPAEMNFKAGERWQWVVEAVTPDGTVRSEPVALEVASEKTAVERQALEERLHPLLTDKESNQGDTALYLMGSYLRSSGFLQDAIDNLTALQARHTDRKELHRELGLLYQAIGRSAEAAEEYRQALEK